MSQRTVVKSDGEPAYRFLGAVVHGVDRALCRLDWRNRDRVPATGGALVVANHISNYDPVALGEYLIHSGRWPRFLGKSDIWKAPVVGYFAKACNQIPVERNTRNAGQALKAAEDALAAGELVVLYPEGTITADPDEWPMTPHSGAARLALASRVPVIPVASWGANHIIPGKKLHLPRFFPRKTLSVIAGDPVDLSDLYDLDNQRLAVKIAGERMMRAITDLLEELRGEVAPEERYDIRKGVRLPRGPVTLGEALGADEK
ncbi:MAG TPA: 1-acyl-sn-glycerol-3-phosphate acyltransferase [Candidatus Luteococcus avicola]|nr:1-acyl-sn-glycerol-3-phosphate acyltransferase [Candidatus Luteococcus avicola]